MEEACYCIDNLGQIISGQSLVNRQAQYGLRLPFADGEIALSIPQGFRSVLQMNRNRIMDSCADAVQLQVSLKLISLFGLYNERVPAGFISAFIFRNPDHVAEMLYVILCIAPSL